MARRDDFDWHEKPDSQRSCWREQATLAIHEQDEVTWSQVDMSDAITTYGVFEVESLSLD